MNSTCCAPLVASESWLFILLSTYIIELKRAALPSAAAQLNLIDVSFRDRLARPHLNCNGTSQSDRHRQSRESGAPSELRQGDNDTTTRRNCSPHWLADFFINHCSPLLFARAMGHIGAFSASQRVCAALLVSYFSPARRDLYFSAFLPLPQACRSAAASRPHSRD